jgi:hypothetical protein
MSMTIKKEKERSPTNHETFSIDFNFSFVIPGVPFFLLLEVSLWERKRFVRCWSSREGLVERGAVVRA